MVGGLVANVYVFCTFLINKIMTHYIYTPNSFIPYADDDPKYIKEQEEGHKKITEQKQGCSYCVYFDDCHTAVWRKGQTCDLFKGMR